MFMILYIVKIISLQTSSYIQHNPNKNPSMLFCRYQQTDSEVYVEKQDTE